MGMLNRTLGTKLKILMRLIMNKMWVNEYQRNRIIHQIMRTMKTNRKIHQSDEVPLKKPTSTTQRYEGKHEGCRMSRLSGLFTTIFPH